VVGTDGRFTASQVPASQADTIPGRFNANTVDLNRNFDCDWQSKGVWQTRTVSGGSAAFSEPESQAIKAYVEAHVPTAVVVWYSSAGGVFSSNCHTGVLPETRAITKVFADASGYPAYESFDFYATTGDMVNWLAKKSIPAISVLLTTHTDVEWDKNKAGVDALLKHYAK
ncbi:MAG TPA: M14 family metallopeptidase, partial [Candidatus Paceibacterota bacterium]|nr:M14 family metallopeptidase [Candidatus Paceibacterota bacterium]